MKSSLTASLIDDEILDKFEKYSPQSPFICFISNFFSPADPLVIEALIVYAPTYTRKRYSRRIQ